MEALLLELPPCRLQSPLECQTLETARHVLSVLYNPEVCQKIVKANLVGTLTAFAKCVKKLMEVCISRHIVVLYKLAGGRYWHASYKSWKTKFQNI